MSKVRELHIEKLSHEGRGIAHYEGKTQFVEGALPGESVTATVLTERKTWDALTTQTILTPSKDRVPPPCPHYNQCGGCQLQHLAYPEQVAAKAQTLAERLSRATDKELPDIVSIAGEPHHYRTRARLACWYHPRNKQYHIGFREEKSKHITPVEECIVLHPALSRLIAPLTTLVTSLKLEKSLGHIDLQLSDTNTAAFCLRVAKPLSQHQSDQLATFTESHQCIGDWQSGEVFGQKPTFTYALDNTIQLQFHWGDFTQANRTLNQSLVNEVMELLNLADDDILLDAFSGLGNFSLPAAQRGARVIGVEGSEAMVNAAAQNATLNQLSNIEFLHRNLMDETSLKSLKKYKCNKVLLDPPRDGAYVLCQWLAKHKPHQIVYVSCHSASLARDAKVLTEAGYVIQELINVDMFPHSHHAEAVCCFVRNK